VKKKRRWSSPRTAFAWGCRAQGVGQRGLNRKKNGILREGAGESPGKSSGWLGGVPSPPRASGRPVERGPTTKQKKWSQGNERPPKTNPYSTMIYYLYKLRARRESSAGIGGPTERKRRLNFLGPRRGEKGPKNPVAHRHPTSSSRYSRMMFEARTEKEERTRGEREIGMRLQKEVCKPETRFSHRPGARPEGRNPERREDLDKKGETKAPFRGGVVSSGRHADSWTISGSRKKETWVGKGTEQGG